MEKYNPRKDDHQNRDPHKTYIVVVVVVIVDDDDVVVVVLKPL